MNRDKKGIIPFNYKKNTIHVTKFVELRATNSHPPSDIKEILTF